MKEMYIVNKKECKADNNYSASDFQNFTQVNNFNKALWTLTFEKDTILLVDKIVSEDNLEYKVEELDYDKVFNSKDISPIKKVEYFKKMKDMYYKYANENYKKDAWSTGYLIETMKELGIEDKYFNAHSNMINIINECKDLDFSLEIVLGNHLGYDIHLQNIIDNDSTGEYLKYLTKLRTGDKNNAEIIVNKLIEITKNTCDLNILMCWLLNLVTCKESNMTEVVDLYEILNLIDEYDKEGKYYIQLNKALPYFELNYIQTRIIELAKANEDCTYCIEFLDTIAFNKKFRYYKSIRLYDFIDVIVENDNIKSLDIHQDIIKYISQESVSKLDNKFGEEELGIYF